jgi:signal transduction histidine kinase
MLARCGAAGCILVLVATFLFASIAIGRDAAATVLIAGSYTLLGLSAVVFLAGEAAQVVRKSRLGRRLRRAGKRRLAAAPISDPAHAGRPPAAVDDLVGMLGNTLKLATPIPAVDRLEPVDVMDVLRDLPKTHKTARLRLVVRRRPLHTLASRPALARALEILVENALSNGLRASVSCDCGTTALVVHVDDDGPGVPKSDRLRVFDWHYYMTTPPSEQTGCRVELVIARQILRAHGGDLTVGPSPFGGARFTARMPLLGDHEMELAAAS